jgi:hypothetical protein
MRFRKLDTNRLAAGVNRRVETAANHVIRSLDRARGRVRLGGRRAPYNDEAYEFDGGPAAALQRKHYEKSLRLLWKAETHAPWSGMRDDTAEEKRLRDQAFRAMSEEEKAEHARMTRPEFRELLDREYTQREKEAIVAVLAGIGHGEAYAWLVSSDLIGRVKSTGARAALTMQVLEEAKHFLVLRELVRAFEVPIPRQSAWEYLLMEGVMKAEGVEKLFGMNIVVEGIALSFFHTLQDLPGLEVLRLFHLDEARHAALPSNYFKEFPLSWAQRNHPIRRARRLKMILPALALIPHIEEDLAEIGVDAFDFGGAIIRRIAVLSERNGFAFPLPYDMLLRMLDEAFHLYCRATRRDHQRRAFLSRDVEDLSLQAVDAELREVA